MPDEIALKSERTETHRLFYVDHDYSSNNEEYKIAGDSQNMSNIIRALRQINPDTNHIFGVFGEKISLETFVYSLFPNDHTRINSMFATINPMPAIWTVHNSTNFVFLLLLTHDTTSKKKENYFIVVMQRLLQDICQNILIYPSETFFLNFSTEHSFHGKPHETRTYRQVKIERVNVELPQKVKLNDKNILHSILDEKCQNILLTNNTQNTYCVQKTLQDLNQNTTNNKFDKLKESLQIQIDTNELSMRLILKVFEQRRILLSKTQKTQMENNFTAHTKAYEQDLKSTNDHAHVLIKELLGIKNNLSSFYSSSVEIDGQLKRQLYADTTGWLINPKWIDETAEHFTSRLIVTIFSHKSNQKRNLIILAEQVDHLQNELLRLDKKEKTRQSQENFIKFIILIAQTESHLEVHYNIHRLNYNASTDTENHLQCLTVNSSAPIQISLNDLAVFVNLSDLSESDRLDFSKQIELVACFKMNDGKSEIIMMKRPNIMHKELSPVKGYTVLSHKSGIFRKLTDFYLSNVYVAYAFNQNSNTLVVYNIDLGNVTRCSLDEFGQLHNNPILYLNGRSKKPIGVKSLALTVAQDLLIVIDSLSNVYNLDISGGTSIISLLYKTTNSNDKSNFAADNGDLYQTVQTIGEKNPIFFFQAQSCIDIVDQNYSQIYSIKLDQHSSSRKMQIFTVFVDTYCVLFDTSAAEVYYIQDLISDTRIERQESSTDLEKSGKQYIGNQLLDIIKRGEVQFGVSDSLHDSQYFLVLLSEYSTHSDRIKKYFKDLNVQAKLKIGYEKTDLISSSIDIEQLIKIVVSRVPLQLCTIEMGTLVPLNNGRRDKMDHLSSKSFRIEMKAREISFSYLDDILNDIHNNIKIVGVIGRQFTGKSYLMNKIFQTRFAVAAGRYTDGIWMSYAFLENTHFIILDCEGLFSDQRTEDEEIKLISFLAAVCDITILSQDLGFSRFLDRLFGLLSQAVDKIGKNDKLFKGILLVAVRDISDSNAVESVDAAEKKFLDLQKKGKSGFLEQLFSDTYKIQLLHHFENKNFDYEIQRLRQISIKHVLTSTTTGLQLPCRWENGKDLADRLKILLVQLYTDDLLIQMKYMLI